MKRLKIFLLLSAACLITAASFAQSTNVFLKRNNNLLYNYGYLATATTTDSTLTTVATISLATNEIGIVDVTVVGMNDSLGKGLTGRYTARYSKVAGTLTLASPAAVSAVVTDAALGTATWSITTSSNNIIVQVKGKAPAYTIHWIADIHRTYYKKPS